MAGPDGTSGPSPPKSLVPTTTNSLGLEISSSILQSPKVPFFLRRDTTHTQPPRSAEQFAPIAAISSKILGTRGTVGTVGTGGTVGPAAGPVDWTRNNKSQCSEVISEQFNAIWQPWKRYHVCAWGDLLPSW